MTTIILHWNISFFGYLGWALLTSLFSYLSWTNLPEQSLTGRRSGSGWAIFGSIVFPIAAFAAWWGTFDALFTGTVN